MELIEEDNSVRLKSREFDYLFTNQSGKQLIELVRQNYVEVFKALTERANRKPEVNLQTKELSEVSLEITLYNIFIYNQWKNNYRKMHLDGSDFAIKNLDRTDTIDTLIKYFGQNCIENWQEKCAVLSGMSVDQFMHFYSERQKFYNK